MRREKEETFNEYLLCARHFRVVILFDPQKHQVQVISVS